MSSEGGKNTLKRNTSHRGGPAVWYHMTQIRQRRMISVIAWLIAGSIDGWECLMKTLRQITFFFSCFFFFSSWGAVEESTRRSWCNIDGTVCDVCDFKATITLSGVLRPIPVRVKRKSLTSGELPARREIIQLPALKKLKVGQNLLCCSLQNFKENQVPTWNNRIFGFLFMSWTFYCPPPTCQCRVL